MKCDISISHIKAYDNTGNYQDETYSIRIDGGEFIQNINLSGLSELMALRNALTTYINEPTNDKEDEKDEDNEE